MNLIFTIGTIPCRGIHCIVGRLEVEYGIDHGAGLEIVTCPFLEHTREKRKYLMARVAESVWQATGTDEVKAKSFLENLRKFIVEIGQPLKLTDIEGCVVKPGDVGKVTKMVMDSAGGKNFGINGDITEDIVRSVLSQSLL
jgi:alcohol dehydrogenase YqhD (iron-dependent ADH family)